VAKTASENKHLKGTKQCKVCTKEFEAYRDSHLYCSDNCRWYFQGQKENTKKRRQKYTKEWNQENKDHRRNYNLQYTFGITLEKYRELLTLQNSCCAICKRHYDTFTKALAVDHDHKTGEIYGLLCDYCNRQLIGRIRKPELFLEAAKYLEKGTGLFVPKKKKKKRKRKKRR